MMLSELQSRNRRTVSMSEAVAPVAFVGDTCLTKGGDVFACLKLNGVDPECLEPAEVASVVARYSAAIRGLGTEYRAYQYLIKRHSPELPDAEHADDVQARRLRFLAGKTRDLYQVSLCHAILRVRPRVDASRVKGLIRQFSVRNELRMERAALMRDVAAVNQATASIASQIPGAERLDSTATLAFLRSLINCTPWKASVFPQETPADSHLDTQITRSHLGIWRHHLEQDGYRIKVLSLMDLPAQTFANMLGGLLAVPCNLTICTQWRRESNLLARQEIDKRRRHYHLAKTSMMSYLFEKRPMQHEILVDDSRTSQVDELNNILKEIEVNENYLGRFQLTVTLYDEDPAVIERATAKVTEVFATHDARVVDESVDLENAHLSVIPGNYHRAHRWLWMLNTNYADMSMLFSPAIGDRINTHLWRPCLNVLESNDCTPYYLNLHYQDVAHSLLIGSIGSGKSFLMNFLLASLQQYKPYTLILDVGGSYQALTEHYGGSYQRIGQAGGSFSINPFSLAPSAENLEFIFRFNRVLVERDGFSLSVADREDLVNCIAGVYELEPEHRRLGTLARIVRRTTGRRLAEWVGDGRLARFFDNATDNLSLARFQCFDFELQEQPDVLEAMLFYIWHRAKAVIYSDAEISTLKACAMDEVWKFFRHPMTCEEIREAQKTWRKRNALMLLATQSGDDLVRSELLPVIVESTFTKFFLANPGMDIGDYRETFHLNATEAAKIARLMPKRQFLVKRPDGAKVLNLNVDPQAVGLFSIPRRNHE